MGAQGLGDDPPWHKHAVAEQAWRECDNTLWQCRRGVSVTTRCGSAGVA